MDKTTYFLAFSRLAPVQAVWWGNPDTTGVPTIDYYLTSEHEHESHRDHYSEPIYQFKLAFCLFVCGLRLLLLGPHS